MSTSSPGPVNLEQVKKHSVFINLQVDLPKREIDHVFPSYGGGGWDPGSGLIYTVNIYIYMRKHRALTVVNKEILHGEWWRRLPALLLWGLLVAGLTYGSAVRRGFGCWGQKCPIWAKNKLQNDDKRQTDCEWNVSPILMNFPFILTIQTV